VSEADAGLAAIIERIEHLAAIRAEWNIGKEGCPTCDGIGHYVVMTPGLLARFLWAEGDVVPYGVRVVTSEMADEAHVYLVTCMCVDPLKPIFGGDLLDELRRRYGA
jgi:hypothetical protein